MDERGIMARLRGEGLDPGPWSNGPHDVYAPHRHDFDKVLVCARGSITFGLVSTGERVTLARGDRLDLPAGTVHEAMVGPDGVTCLESHLPAGSLPVSPRRLAAGEW